MEYPKVLIINMTFNTYTGSGITMSNLFGDWPSDKIRVATSTSITDFNICKNYYYLGSQDRVVLPPFGLIKKLPKSRVLCDSISRQCAKGPSKNIKLTFYYNVLKLFGFQPILHKYVPSEHFYEWYEEFNPQLIFTHAGSLEIINFVMLLNKKYGTKIVVHINDDYISTMHKGSLLSFYWKYFINKKFKAILKLASIRFSISEYMSLIYNQRYGLRFYPLHNPIDIEFWTNDVDRSNIKGSSFNIMYAGRIGSGISTSLLDIAKAISIIKTKENINFHIQTSYQDHPILKKIKKYSFVKISNYCDYDLLPSILSQMQLLILPYDFTGKSSAFIKLSVPTKLTEYMATGKPILYYGPKDTALYYYIKNNKSALSITQNDIKVLSHKLFEIINNKDECLQIGEYAKELAKKNHAMASIRKSFIDFCIKGINSELYSIHS